MMWKSDKKVENMMKSECFKNRVLKVVLEDYPKLLKREAYTY